LFNLISSSIQSSSIMPTTHGKSKPSTTEEVMDAIFGGGSSDGDVAV
jgi:hypothetical protein